MKKTVTFIFKDIILAIIINVYSPLIISILFGLFGIKYVTNEEIKINNAPNILTSIPSEIWVVFFAIITFWYLLIFLFRRIKTVRSLNSQSGLVRVVTNPNRRNMMPQAGKIKFNKVIWYILQDSVTRTSIGYVDIDTPPRCPRCETKLEEKYGILKKYVWKCVGCNFKRRSNSSFYDVAQSVKNIAERKVEKELLERKFW